MLKWLHHEDNAEIHLESKVPKQDQNLHLVCLQEYFTNQNSPQGSPHPNKG